MRFGTALLATFAIAALAGCSPGVATSTPTLSGSWTATPSPSPSVTSPTPAVPALGSWQAGCSSPDADGAALVRNLTLQPAFSATATPSAEAGWSDALAAAVRPLDECPTAHLLAVAKVVAFGDDEQAGASASARIVGLAKGRTLLLSGQRVGRISIGAGQAESAPVLIAIMGTPTTSTQACEASGESWNVFAWGDFQVSFRTTGAASVLDSWAITPKGTTAPNLRLTDDLPLRGTFTQLKEFKAGLVQEDVFGTGGGPWIAEVRPDLRYHWTEVSD